MKISMIEKILKSKDSKELSEESKYLYEFANLRSNRTGVEKIVVHVYSQSNKELSHGPRIKVSNLYEKFDKNDYFVLNILTLKVEEGKVKIKSKELLDVVKWIKLNRKVLIEYWQSEGVMDTDEFLNSLKKIQSS